MTYADLEARLARWAAGQPDVYTIIIVGSRARPDHAADAWSDLDVILFCTHPTAYTEDQAWLALLGEPRLACLDVPEGGYPEWFVLLPNGLKVDILVAPVPGHADASIQLLQIITAFPYQDILRRGVRVLFTRAGAEQLDLRASFTDGMAAHPSADAFQMLVNRLLFEALRTAKLLRRNDLWRAKQACDCTCKRHLLTLLEWHARALHGLHHDVWYDGRYLARWAEPAIVAAVPETFGTYHATEVRRALVATLRLFGRVGRETAAQLGYRYPIEAEQQVMDEIEAMLEGIEAAPDEADEQAQPRERGLRDGGS